MTKTPSAMTFAALLREIVNEPGILSAAYSAFHNYSIGNQIAAATQLMARGQPLGPICSFYGWKDHGRSVKKGAKALELCMPRTITGIRETDDGGAEEFTFSRFVWKKNWFVLWDTEGEDFEHEDVTPEWDAKLALKTLDIAAVKFQLPDGNCQGYASGRTIAINPVAALPHKTRFHELAHVVLGHTAEARMVDNDRTPVDVKEVEAESTAYILCSLLKLKGLKESRGYVQHWMRGADIPERSAQKIYAAANTILRAGQAK